MNSEEIKKRIKKLCIDKGITLVELAKMLKMSYKTFNSRMNGRTIWNIDEAVNCAEHLDSTVDEIFFT